MRSSIQSERTGRKSTAGSFAIHANATDRAVQIKMAAIFILALLTMIAAGVMTMGAGNASQADGLTSLATQGLTATKSDRFAGTEAHDSCKTQAWGAWSDDCAAALTGVGRVRNVSYVTVETTRPTVNETILARYPTAN